MAIEIQEIKNDDDSHRFLRFKNLSDDSNTRLTEMVAEPEGDNVKVILRFDKCDSSNLQQRLNALLGDKMKGAELKSAGGSSIISVVLNTTKNEFWKIAEQLTQTVDLGRGENAYPVMDKEVAGQVIERFMQQHGLSAESQGLWTPKVDSVDGERRISKGVEKDIHYLSFSAISFPGSVITEIKEDAEPNATAFFVGTTLTLGAGHTAAADAIIKAAKSSGINAKAERIRDEPLRIVFEAPAEMVMRSIESLKIMPVSLAKEIAAKAESLHPDQSEINRQIKASLSQIPSWASRG